MSSAPIPKRIFPPPYTLHCFGCGELFIRGDHINNLSKCPYCDMCYADICSAEYAAWEEAEFHRENPNWTDQDDIDRANIFKYGEC